MESHINNNTKQGKFMKKEKQVDDTKNHLNASDCYKGALVFKHQRGRLYFQRMQFGCPSYARGSSWPTRPSHAVRFALTECMPASILSYVFSLDENE